MESTGNVELVPAGQAPERALRARAAFELAYEGFTGWPLNIALAEKWWPLTAGTRIAAVAA